MNEWRPWQYVLAGLLAGLALAFSIFWLASQPRGAAVVLEPLPTPGLIQVHVAGAVQAPGLYALEPSARAAQAIELAGGLSADADEAAVNLAEILRDGQQIYVPRRGAPTSAVLSAARVGLLDLNTATLEQLEALPGIGEGRAQDILTYREKVGGFKKVEELLEIPGIGDAIFAELQPLVTILP